MYQIDQLGAVAFSQWFWLALVLAAIYFGIGKGMLPKVEATVDARDAQIAADLAAAERARAGAEEIEANVILAGANARAQAQSVAANAKARGAKDAESRLSKADAEIGAKLAAAESLVGKARNKALANLESVASEAALDIVAKVSGAKISAAQATQAVKAVLANG